jgi:hypothetical protein
MLSTLVGVITRNTFQEYGAFRGATEEAIQNLNSSTASASNRYMKELLLLEEYLTENGLSISFQEFEAERLMIEFISRPAESGSAVVAPVPEFLPLLRYQTVARLRNKVTRRLTDSQLAFLKSTAWRTTSKYSLL